MRRKYSIDEFNWNKEKLLLTHDKIINITIILPLPYILIVGHRRSIEFMLDSSYRDMMFDCNKNFYKTPNENITVLIRTR